MDIHSKQLAAINFRVRLGKDSGEILREVYSVECFAKQRIQHWHKSVYKGCQETVGLLRPNRSHSSITEVNINTLEECISNRGHYFEKQPAMVFESNAE